MNLQEDTPAVDTGTPTSYSKARVAFAAASVATAAVAAAAGISGGVLASAMNHSETVLG